MARDAAAARITKAAGPVLVDGERITGYGQCWGTQLRGRTPLLFRARRQYLMALTDRRVLVFERKRKPAPRDLVLGKRYETLTVERVRRRRPLLQIIVNGSNGVRMAFEFRPGQRDVGGELIARLTPKHTAPPGTAEEPTDETKPQSFSPEPAEPDATSEAPPPSDSQPAPDSQPAADAPAPKPTDDDSSLTNAFWAR